VQTSTERSLPWTIQRLNCSGTCLGKLSNSSEWCKCFACHCWRVQSYVLAFPSSASVLFDALFNHRTLPCSLGVGTITSVGMLFYAVPALVSQFSVPTPLMASPLLSSPRLTSPLHAAPYPYAYTEDSLTTALVSMSDEPSPTLSPLVPPQYIHYSSWSSAAPWSHRLLLVWLIAVTLFQVRIHYGYIAATCLPTLTASWRFCVCR
jgi:hypothetical protein